MKKEKNVICLMILMLMFLTGCAKESGCDLKQYKNNAEKYMQTNKHNAIIKETTICIAQYPDYANLYNNRGNAYKNLKQYEKALADYNKAIEINKSYPTPYLSRGNLNIELLKIDDAIKDFDIAIKLNPNNGVAYSSRATAKTLKKDFEGAKKDIKKLEELGMDKSFIEYHYKLIEQVKTPE